MRAVSLSLCVSGIVAAGSVVSALFCVSLHSYLATSPVIITEIRIQSTMI